MQNAADAKRLVSLGIRNTKVKVTGNVKFDQQFDETENAFTEKFRARFNISADAPLIVAASTHAPEEKWILDAFKTIYKSSSDKLPRLLLVPRHPERFAEVAGLIKETGFDWARRSESPSARDKSAEIILLDSIGELRAVYPLAEIVFVGGSLIPHGGQNVLEPAAARKAIVTGFYTTNFEAIVREFLEKDAIVQLPEVAEKEISQKLAASLAALLGDAARREKIAENAFRVTQANRGASRKTIEYLKPIFEAKKLHHRDTEGKK
jgi:3-deoxy-D-manno-octulosonic-acid transferase